MGVLTLNIECRERGVKKTMQFEPRTLVHDACRLVRDKLGPMPGNPNDYGLFRVEEDPTKCVWMENGRTLEYYLIRNGDTLEYKNKIRPLRVRTLDGGTVKTVFVDESQPVSQLMVVICSKMGIANHEEYSLVRGSPLGIDGVEDGVYGRDQQQQVQRSDRERTPYSNGTDQYEVGQKGPKGKGGLENTFMSTIGRKKERQIQQLRAKLHTEEEIHWVDHSRTLREQNIKDDEELTLRRKFFFSDTNVDTRDPVQLNLLYIQCRDGVLRGLHPVSRDTAIKLASLQCYIEYGPFEEGIQRSVDAKNLLPKEYARAKELEKNIIQEYRELMYEDSAAPKKKYCELCQSLPTYGVSFFLVKEKVPGKNKLIPRLLGVNKESVMRVDERTKAVLKEWPLEQVRRWAASYKTFTLDFGDYKDGYYSVQTLEGERIGQLIGGYIDIILKKKRIVDHTGIEGDEGSTMVEDIVAPAKATLLAQSEPAPIIAQEPGAAVYGVLRPEAETPTRAPQYGGVSGMILAQEMPRGERLRYMTSRDRSQRALVGTIEATIRAVEEAEEEISKPPQIDLPRFGETQRHWRVEVEKESVGDRLAAMGAATAEVVQLTAIPEESVVDTRVGDAIATIGSNLPEMGRGVRELAALLPDEHRAGDLIDAARKLCGAFSNFLDKVHPEHQEKRANILSAASRVGELSHDVISTMQERTEEERTFHEELNRKARSVATSTAQLVLQAKTVSAECDEPQLKDQVIHSAMKTAYATSELVACTRVVGPTIEHQLCKEHLTEAAYNVSRAVQELLEDASSACQRTAPEKGAEHYENLRDAATRVIGALDDLIGHVQTGPWGYHRKTQQDYTFEQIVESSHRILTHPGGPSRQLYLDSETAIRNSQLLVDGMEQEANQLDSVQQRDRLLNAARNVARATSSMIDATRECQSRPGESEPQLNLKDAAEQLVQASSRATIEGARGTQACIDAAQTVSGIIGDLDTTIMFATSGSLNPPLASEGPASSPQRVASTPTMTTGHFINVDHRDLIVRTAKALVEDTKALVSGAASNQEQLAVAAQNAVRTILQLTEAVKSGASNLSPDSAESQVMVIHAVRDVASALSNLIQATTYASGRGPNDPAIGNLKDAAKVMVSNVSSLLRAIKTIEDSSQRGVQALESAMNAIDLAVKQFNNDEFPGQQVSTGEDVIRASRAVTHAAEKAAGSASLLHQENVIAAANLARQSVGELLAIVRASAMNVENVDLKYRMLNSGREVALQLKSLLANLLQLHSRPDHPATKQAVLTAAKEISKIVGSLALCGEQLRSSSSSSPEEKPLDFVENELLGAASSIEAVSNKLAMIRPRQTQRADADLKHLTFDEHILSAAKSITTAVQTLVKAAYSAQRELVSEGRMSEPSLILTKDEQQWTEGLVSAAKLVAASTSQLCEAANGVVQGHSTEEKLIAAAKQVASSTAHLLVACKVKSGVDSSYMQRLQSAGHAVRTATEHLVNAARQVITESDCHGLVISDRMVTGIAQVMDAHEEVLRKERELTEARNRLAQLNKSRYEKSPEPSPEK